MAAPSAEIRKPDEKQTRATVIAQRGPLRSTRVPPNAADRPEHDDGELEGQRALRAAEAERGFERRLEHAPGVGLADGEVDGERGGRDEPAAPARGCDGGLMIPNGRNDQAG